MALSFRDLKPLLGLVFNLQKRDDTLAVIKTSGNALRWLLIFWAFVLTFG